MEKTKVGVLRLNKSNLNKALVGCPPKKEGGKERTKTSSYGNRKVHCVEAGEGPSSHWLQGSNSTSHQVQTQSL